MRKTYALSYDYKIRKFSRLCCHYSTQILACYLFRRRAKGSEFNREKFKYDKINAKIDRLYEEKVNNIELDFRKEHATSELNLKIKIALKKEIYMKNLELGKSSEEIKEYLLLFKEYVN